MVRSQNVLFKTRIEDDPNAHPPGEELSRRLAESLKKDGFSLCEPNNWRDCGWSIDVIYNSRPFEISIASANEDGWMAQVVASDQPGLIARLFGAKTKDRASELFKLALSIQNALSEIGCLDAKWKIDGYPDETATPEPIESPG